MFERLRVNRPRSGACSEPGETLTIEPHKCMMQDAVTAETGFWSASRSPTESACIEYSTNHASARCDISLTILHAGTSEGLREPATARYVPGTFDLSRGFRPVPLAETFRIESIMKSLRQMLHFISDDAFVTRILVNYVEAAYILVAVCRVVFF